MPLLLAALMIASTLQDHHADVNRRGSAVMGFDQAAATHHFLLKPDGGRIEITANDPNDADTIAMIRMHLQHVSKSFAAGDFTAPMLIHAQEPPGVKTMKALGSAIEYVYEPIDRGGVLRIVAATRDGQDAVHEFLRFQIKDHRTGDPARPSR